jgi:anionic cell wall polymer biosynthesis LytR-Cps2A-Psr (LCP) family protein
LKKYNLLKIGVFLLIFILGFSIGFFIYGKLIKKSSSGVPSVEEAKITDDIPNPNIQVGENNTGVKTITPDSTNSINIVFLGMGGVGHDGGGLTDSITLANFNYSTKIINLIAIPRDLWYSNQKINAVYSAQKGEGIKYTIGQITGLGVDHFIAVDFSNFISGIDSLGGINVDNPKTWTDEFYPIKGKEQELCGFTPEYNAEVNQKYKGFELEKQFTCRYEKLSFSKGLIHLNGSEALKYIRSRHSADYGSDFARGERSQAVLVAIGKKMLEENLTETTNTAFKKLISSVSSDISLTKVTEIIKTVGEISSYKIIHTYLTDQNVLTSATGPGGAYILVPKTGIADFDGVRSYIKNSN